MVHSIRNIFPQSNVARYNVTAWQRPDNDNTILIGREVVTPGLPGEPDIGNLVLVEMDSTGNIVRDQIIWEPRYESLYLEDPRALEIADGQIVVGFTALLRTKTSLEPFPALAFIDPNLEEMLPPVTIIQTFGPGKNMTPIGHNRYLFRPEHSDYNHSLLLFHLKGGIPNRITDIVFPKSVPWAQWRLGTTIPPLWLPNGEGLLFIHGINRVDGKYIYSIGIARLIPDNDGYQVKVSSEPIITPDMFIDADGHNLVNELRPNERRVVYVCGGLIRRSNPTQIILYVNVGDKTTFEVILDRQELEQVVTQL
jgi:predicted GH43/DUF377 family glycosyl hydrolase